MKVELLREPWTGYHNPAVGPRPAVVTRSLPFYRTRYKPSGYVHRVRSALRMESHGYVHLSIRLWCGSHGSVTRHGELLADVPQSAVACGTCEGRAVGAGMEAMSVIVRHPVKFSPRRVS